MNYILDINNISKRFGNNIALKNINLKVSKGEIIGIIGSNGSGKTTLIEIIAGVIKPTSGEINYNFDYQKTFKEKIGVQFQDSSYPSGLTVRDIILFACNLHKLEIKKSNLKSLLETFQMGGLYKKRIRSLSGGEKQKISILLSIIHNPEIVILDELTTGLDISARKEIITFTKKMIKDRDISVFLISHHMDEIELLVDKVVILSDGQIVKNDTISNIEKKYGKLSDYMVKLISSNKKEIEKDFMNLNIFNLKLISIAKMLKYLGIKKFIKLLKDNWKKNKDYESNF